ncbi:hypothetical protein PUN4_1120035 [Paraburkholderia unamae]|nr:hypothetical protein PUN4_1120035 [Paraburkholderia unamae]
MADFLLRPSQMIADCLGVSEQRAASGSQRRAMRRTIDQRHTYLAFQFDYPCRHRRLSDLESTRGRAHATGVNQRNQGFQLVQFHHLPVAMNSMLFIAIDTVCLFGLLPAD